jgi:hypothetical protein
MIPGDKKYVLVAIYLYICNIYEQRLTFECLRFSNNSRPKFTDQELMTIYLFAATVERRFKITEMYDFANSYLKSWFPDIPSYPPFVVRLNRLSPCFKMLSEILIVQGVTSAGVVKNTCLLDSMPIITCSGKRKGKVASEITDKGYNATKVGYFYGLKLHALAYKRSETIPYPASLVVSEASKSDLTAFKESWSQIPSTTFYGDKIYHNAEYFDQMEATLDSRMRTPVKGVKGKPDLLKQMDKAADDLYSRAVSSVRQPIESFFNWLIERTDIQRASKVRSTRGLLVHVFGKIAAAFIYVIFNS